MRNKFAELLSDEFFSNIHHDLATPSFLQDLRSVWEYQWGVHKDGRYYAEFEVPGAKRTDLAVEIKDRSVRVTGSWKRTDKSRKIDVLLPLPTDADAATIKASMVDGVLTLSFQPVNEPVKPPKIEIQEG